MAAEPQAIGTRQSPMILSALSEHCPVTGSRASAMASQLCPRFSIPPIKPSVDLESDLSSEFLIRKTGSYSVDQSPNPRSQSNCFLKNNSSLGLKKLTVEMWDGLELSKKTYIISKL
jgi:hypothetical protein